MKKLVIFSTMVALLFAFAANAGHNPNRHNPYKHHRKGHHHKYKVKKVRKPHGFIDATYQN